MKIRVNLASQPFRGDRAMLAASIAVSALLAFTLGALTLLALADRSQIKDVRTDINRLNNDIRRVSALQSQMDAILRRPENAEVLERSVFLNALLVRKGISWTRIFADLEKVLPYNVRVIQMHPNIDARNHVILDMQVGAESPEPVIEFLKGLQQPPFGRPKQWVQQSPTQAEPLYRYRVSADYAQKLP
jgi:type IV pilus assembly protein PilN